MVLLNFGNLGDCRCKKVCSFSSGCVLVFVQKNIWYLQLKSYVAENLCCEDWLQYNLSP